MFKKIRTPHANAETSERPKTSLACRNLFQSIHLCESLPAGGGGARVGPCNRRAVSVVPPAIPTPRTYIQPSTKSNRWELNSEVI